MHIVLPLQRLQGVIGPPSKNTIVLAFIRSVWSQELAEIIFYLLKKCFTFAECATMSTNSRYSTKAFLTLTRASLLVTEVDEILLLEKRTTWSSIKLTSGENTTKILCCFEDRHKVFFSLSSTWGINRKELSTSRK